MKSLQDERLVFDCIIMNLPKYVCIQGDHSTKVEGVVKCLMKIQKDDLKAKSLVFSTVRYF